MFDSDFAKAALKEYGAPVILLVALYVLKQIGLLEFDSFNNSLTVGMFFGGIILIIITMMVYFQNVNKTLKSSSNQNINNILESLKRTESKITETYSAVSSHSNQSNQMHYLIMNVYDIVKGIPNKGLIYEGLIIRTRYLLNDILEPILEYTVTCATPLNSDQITRIQNKLDRQIAKIKTFYLESISKISRNLITEKNKAELDSILEERLSRIYSIITSGHTDVADILYKTHTEIKDLEDVLKDIFKTVISEESIVTISRYENV